MIGVKPDTLARWRMEGRGPRYIKLGPSKTSPIRYLHETVRRWVLGRLPEPTEPERDYQPGEPL